MRVANTLRGSDLLSPLAVDLAASRLSLTALKALSGVPPSPEDRSIATRLRQSLGRELGRLQSAAAIPPKVVPSDVMRRELEETLSTLAHVGPAAGPVDVALLQSIVSLLTRIEEGNLSSQDAEDLVQALSRVDPQSKGSTPLPDLMPLLQSMGRAG
jgi:hypothetical protein